MCKKIIKIHVENKTQRTTCKKNNKKLTRKFNELCEKITKKGIKLKKWRINEGWKYCMWKKKKNYMNYAWKLCETYHNKNVSRNHM